MGGAGVQFALAVFHLRRRRCLLCMKVDRVSSRHLPGEPGIWILILGDLVLFSLLFILLLIYRADNLPVFAASQAQLSQPLGLLNTLFMLTSSWCVASGIQAARRQVPRLAAACFGSAWLCGLGFIVVKYVEYGAKIAAGITPVTNTFFMFYFVCTGIHLIHVVIGMGVLTAIFLHSRRGEFSARKIQHFESGASFWHLVDLLWIVLFALLYLLVY